MVKKVLFLGIAAALLFALFFGTASFSHISTGIAALRGKVQDRVPIEFQIERARKMIQDLEPEIRDNMHKIVREEVDVANLEKEIQSRERGLAKNRREVLRLRDDLESENSHYVYAGRSYTADEVRNDLAARWKVYRSGEDTVQNLRSVLGARQAKLAAARQNVDKMVAAKKLLLVDIERMEARLQMVEVAKTTSEFNFDDSQLARTKELVDEINTRLDVAEKLLDSEGQLYGRIPLDDEPQASDDILDEITAHFSDEPEVGSLVGSQN